MPNVNDLSDKDIDKIMAYSAKKKKLPKKRKRQKKKK